MPRVLDKLWQCWILKMNKWLTRTIKKYNILHMIIQNKTENEKSVVRKLEQILDREETKADKFLANALRTANEEGRSDMLYSEMADYEVLYECSKILNDVVEEVKQHLGTDTTYEEN